MLPHSCGIEAVGVPIVPLVEGSVVLTCPQVYLWDARSP